MVSVIIPTYNCAKYLPQTIKSVLNQSYKNLEIIVVDDGSTDDTEEILKPFLSNIIYIKKRHSGVSDARNLGIERAKGNFIAFLDSDDFWTPEKLEVQMDHFRNNPDVGLVYSSNCFIDEDGNELIVPQRVSKEGKYKMCRGWVFRRLLFINFIPTSSVVAKTECLKKAGGFNPYFKKSQDYDLWLRIARFCQFAFINSDLCIRRVRRTGLTLTNVDQMYSEHIEILKNAKATFADLNLSDRNWLRRGLSEQAFDWGLEYLSIEDFKRARRHFMDSLIYWPLNLKFVPYLLLGFLPPSFKLFIKQQKSKLRCM